MFETFIAVFFPRIGWFLGNGVYASVTKSILSKDRLYIRLIFDRAMHNRVCGVWRAPPRGQRGKRYRGERMQMMEGSVRLQLYTHTEHST